MPGTQGLQPVARPGIATGFNTLSGSVLPATLQSLSPDAYVQASRMALSLAESSHTDLPGHFSDLRASHQF